MSNSLSAKLAALTGTAVVALSIACSGGSAGSVDGFDSTGSGWGNGGGGPSYNGGDAGSTASAAEQLFRAVQPRLVSKCGGACHEAGATLNAPKFLTPDAYLSIKAYPGMVTDDIFASKLMNRPSGHPAATLLDPGNETLKADVEKWLNAEALVLKATPLPSSSPTDVSSGSVDLSALGAQMAGAKLTFSAQLDGTTMRFDQLKLVAPSATGVHAVAPILVMVPSDAKSAEVADKSFSAVDVTVAAGKSTDLASPFYFFNWTAGSKLKIEFTKFDAATVVEVDASVGGCKDVATFKASAAPELKNSCAGCHGGSNANATAAMDLSKLATNDFTGACNQVLFKVNTTDKAKSNLLLAPLAGSGLNHQGGKPYANTGSAGYQALQTWVNKE